ncbi:VOC family protein [Agromyces sp. G08B096]|uniref:VOC family protein n=1 Tax=Agromyces sp. G08B096 TaxID=3156399 RepID=A0AAU7W9F1_9MICO
MPGIVHFEIPADDQDRAKQFYRSAFDWVVEPIPGMDDYTAVRTTPADEETGQPLEPGAINGAIFRREGQLTNPVLTVDVEDVDRALERVVEAGGTVVAPRAAVPGMGWFAYFADPEGNVLGLWTTDEGAA